MDPVAARIWPLEILGDLQNGPKPSPPVGLLVEATDAAGNMHRTDVLRFSGMDFAVPKIECRGRLTAMHDERFADLWKVADPALQSTVTDARTRPDALLRRRAAEPPS